MLLQKICLVFFLPMKNINLRVPGFKCRSSLLERMPVLDEASYLVKRATATQATISANKHAPTVAPGGLKLPNGVAKPTSAPLADLLDLSSDGAPASTTTSTTPNDFLQDLLGIGGVSTSTAGILFASIPVISCVVSMLACFSDYVKRAKGLY